MPQQKPQQAIQDETRSPQGRNSEIEIHSENDVASQTNETMLNTHKTTSLTDCKDTCFPSLDEAILKLQDRLVWAANQLGGANSIEMDIKMCELISSCGNALQTLKDLQH